MQSTLKIMPDPIAEVPRDNRQPLSDGGLRDNREKFDSVYEQQLHEHQNVRIADQNRDSGNDSQQKRQQNDERRVDQAQSKQAENDRKADIAATNKAGDSADVKANSKADSQAQASADAASKNAEADNKAQSAFDKFVGVMRGSGDMLHKTNGERQADGVTSKHNKLAAAIDSVLTERDKKLPEGNDEDAIANMIKQSLKGQTESSTTNSTKLDSIQTPGFNPNGGGKEGGKLDGMITGVPGNIGLAQTAGSLGTTGTSTGNTKPDIFQTPDILPGDGSDQSESSGDSADFQTAGIKPNRDGSGTGGSGNGSTPIKNVFQTPDINPPSQPGQGTSSGGLSESGSQNTGTVAPSNPNTGGLSESGTLTAGTVAPSNPNTGGLSESGTQNTGTVAPTNPNNTATQAGQSNPDMPIKNVFQTPDILPGEADISKDPIVKTAELAESISKSFGNLFTDGKPKLGSGGSDNIAGAGAKGPNSPADATLAQAGGGAQSGGDGKSQNGENILGTANQANKTPNAQATAAANLASEQAGKINPDAQMTEKQLSDQKLVDALAAENQLNKEVGLSEERPARFMPKDLNAAQMNRAPGAFTAPTVSASTITASTAATDSKLAAQEMTRLQEAISPDSPDFSKNMKERLTIMMNKGVQSADMRLDPGELGQMQVKMAVENDVTSVSFTVQNTQAKELLEQAMPRLREMLEEQGIEMGEGTVHQEDKQQQQALGDSQNNGGNGDQDDQSDEEAALEQLAAQQVKITNGALGGIDFFA